MYANNWFSNTLKTEKASAYTGTQKDILILTNIYKAKSEIEKNNFVVHVIFISVD